jgi:hypothetical protein
MVDPTRVGAPHEGGAADQAWRNKLTPKPNGTRKGVKARCTCRYLDGRRCGGGPVPGTGLCGPHLDQDERVAAAALVTLAAAFGAPDDPVTVRLVAHRQPAAVAALLTTTGRDLAARRATHKFSTVEKPARMRRS